MTDRGRPSAADRRSTESGQIEEAFGLLADLTRQFADTLDLEATLERALLLIVAHLGAQAGSLWLVNDERTEITCHASVGPNQITGLVLPISQGIVGRSVRENHCQRVFDVSKDPAFSQAADEQSGFVTRSLVCAPMTVSEKVIGAIELVNKRGGDGRFVETDVPPLQVLAASAALAIVNARMAASLMEAERVRRELELAAEIQRSLLPARRSEPFPVVGINLPARVVSGDFFDVLPLADGRIGFCLGDVSGKGMNAALLMAKTASLYRCLARSSESPGAVLTTLNREICETSTRGMFVTMAAGVFDLATGVVQLANAGHEPPLHHRTNRTFGSLPADAPPLGVLPDADFGDVELRLEGGSLYLCSDGLTEAAGETGEPLGAEGLQRLVTRFAAKPVAERVDAIAAAVGRLELRDDLTLLAVADEGLGR